MCKFAVGGRGVIIGYNKDVDNVSGRRMPVHQMQTALVLLILIFAGCLNRSQYVEASSVRSVDVNSNKLETSVIELNEENWRLILNGEWMIEFYAPWCPACKNLSPTWERFATACNEIDINVAKVDVTTSTSLSGRFFVTALPTIYHVKNNEFRQYRGSRDFDALMFFIKQKQWNKLEPIPSWKKPDTIHMSILSYIFKLSHTLKDFNAQLQEEYGLPTWAAYAFFAIGTIFVGAALGLVLVCVLDFVYPPKRAYRQSFSETKNKEEEENGVEDLANDEIEDDDDENENENEVEDENEEDDDDDEEDEDDDDNDNDNDNDDEEDDNDDDENDDEELKHDNHRDDDKTTTAANGGDDENIIKDGHDVVIKRGVEEVEQDEDDDKVEAEGKNDLIEKQHKQKQKQKQKQKDSTDLEITDEAAESDKASIKAAAATAATAATAAAAAAAVSSASPGEVRKRKPRKAD